MTEFNLQDRVSVNGMIGIVVSKSYQHDERVYIVRFDTGHQDTFKGSQLEAVERAA